ncbi:MAG: flagellar hook-basal body complex protein [Pseudomonadota bacterium]
MSQVLQGGLNASTTGLGAQSTKLSAISDNIANVNTVGFKRAEVQFSTIVTKSISEISFTPAGVEARPRQVVDEQGAFTTTGNSTDFSISGNGFFVVAEASGDSTTILGGVSGSSDLLFTRSGSFRIDENGLLRNTAGFYLQGWPVNSQGQVARDGVNLPPTVENLETVDAQRISGIAKETDNVRVKTNIPANFSHGEPGDYTPAAFIASVSTNAAAGAGNVIDAAPVSTGAIANDDFTQTFTVFDAQGVSHDVTVGYTRLDGAVEPNVYGMRIVSAQNSDGTNLPIEEVNFGFLRDDVGEAVGDAQLQDRVLARFNGDGSLEGLYADDDGAGNVDDTTRIVDRSTDASSTPALLQVVIGATDNDDAVTGVDDVETNPNFGVDGDSRLFVSVQEIDGSLTSPFGENGAQALTFEFNVGRPTSNDNGTGTAEFNGTGLDGLTAFSQPAGEPVELQTYFLAQDGSRFALLQDLTIDEFGTVTAIYDNGITRPVYKIPVATVANPNGLQNLSGNVYKQSDDSGEILLNFAQSGLAGETIGGALENSNVDLSTEFTEMIVTQQGFTANTRAITTTRDLMIELVNMVR